MRKEEKTQAKVGVGVETFWRALTKDLRFVIPATIPNLVKEVEIIEGDGGLGTVFLFKFSSNVPTMNYQKEKMVELDETLHQIGLQVIGGGHLNYGFSSYKTAFKLSAIGESETLIDVKVVYETEVEETHVPGATTKSALIYIQCLENYLSNRDT